MERMYEVVLYATLAVIVCTVLYSVLGRQIGRGPDEGGPDLKGPEGTTQDFKPKVVEPKRSDKRSERLSEGVVAPLAGAGAVAAPAGLAAILAAEPDFTEVDFLDTATEAYSMVLEAFAAGDRETLGFLLTPRMLEIYTDAIESRERQELTQVTDILRIARPKLLDARAPQKGNAREAEIDVAFTSELSSALVDAVGQPVQGDPDLVATVREVWTFSRRLGSDDPAWLLSDVAPETADGDAGGLEADPAPDTKPGR